MAREEHVSTPHQNASGMDRDKVRLTWPGEVEPAPDTSPEPGTARPARPEPGARPAVRRGDAPLRPAPIVPAEVDSASGLRRTIVEAYDRLADRLTQRLRSVHDDLDADLAALRAEMAGLRQSVDDLDDRAQLRDIQAAIEEVREDVATLRAEVGERAAAQPAGAGGPAAYPRVELLAPLLTEMAAMREALEARPDGSAAPDLVLEELAALRTQVASLRRRINLRAAPPP